MIEAPPPRMGGTRIFCPMVDVAATEAQENAEKLVMCPWSGRNTRNDRYRYRRHWRRDHMQPFLDETHAMVQYLVKGQWIGQNVPARITVSK